MAIATAAATISTLTRALRTSKFVIGGLLFFYRLDLVNPLDTGREVA
jgi:hypothetical protein